MFPSKIPPGFKKKVFRTIKKKTSHFPVDIPGIITGKILEDFLGKFY